MALHDLNRIVGCEVVLHSMKDRQLDGRRATVIDYEYGATSMVGGRYLVMLQENIRGDFNRKGVGIGVKIANWSSVKAKTVDGKVCLSSQMVLF